MKYLSDQNTLKLDSGLCIGCGRCMEVCPHGVIQQPIHIEHQDACMECGACQMNCPVEAITVSAGVGCAAAMLLKFVEKTPFRIFFKKDCC